jgi:peptidyl-prolyl cis-trans isomerase D
VAVTREVNMQRQQIAQAGTEVPAPLAALFAIPQGRAHVMPAPDGSGWFVVYHAQRTPGDASVQANAVSLMRRSLDETTAEELAQQFARAVNLVAEPERNEEAIARVRRDLMGVGAE